MYQQWRDPDGYVCLLLLYLPVTKSADPSIGAFNAPVLENLRWSRVELMKRLSLNMRHKNLDLWVNALV